MADPGAVRMVIAWDAREPGWNDGRRLARTDWLREHGVNVDITYRVEFYPDGSHARVFMYALDSKGRKHLGPEHSSWSDHDHGACRPAVELPVILPLDELPPGFLLGD